MTDEQCHQLINRDSGHRICFLSQDKSGRVFLGRLFSHDYSIRVRACPRLVMKLWKLL